MLMEDVKRIVHELDQGQQLSSIGVELVDNELAILYMNSKKSEVNFLLFQLSLTLPFIRVSHPPLGLALPCVIHCLVIHPDSDLLIFGSRQNIMCRLPCRDQHQPMYRVDTEVI